MDSNADGRVSVEELEAYHEAKQSGQQQQNAPDPPLKDITEVLSPRSNAALAAGGASMIDVRLTPENVEELRSSSNIMCIHHAFPYVGSMH